MKFKVLSVLALVIWSSGLFSQTKKSTQKTEILTYDSAVYDPTSEETQVVFKNSANQKKIFYYSKQDELKLEEQFFNKPVQPITVSGLNLTKNELNGKKYKITYYALTEQATEECCFKMSLCESVK
jgi:hypothetical protein